MPGESRKSLKGQLARAIGQGMSIAEWARANKVVARTAFRWANDPKVRKAVDTYRRRTMDQAIGRMTKHSMMAADGIAAIAQEAASDSVRLRAFRALFSDTISVSKYTGLEFRVTEMEEKLENRDAAAKGTIASPSRVTYGPSAPPAKPPLTQGAG
jgi:hypothetical protein